MHIGVAKSVLSPCTAAPLFVSLLGRMKEQYFIFLLKANDDVREEIVALLAPVFHLGL